MMSADSARALSQAQHLAVRLLALERENNALRVLKPAGGAQLDLLQIG